MLKLKKITKEYQTGDFIQKALNGINLEFRENEFVSILGASGSGKTTLLNIIGGLDRYTSGDLIINGKSTKKFKSRDWDSYRNNSIGFIFQSYNLIGHMSILSNVELCMTLSGVSKKERKRRATEALTKVGLEKHIHKKPSELSGGQMQRVAIARALVNDPDIILADEPTGALDSKTSVQIMELIKEISKDKLVIMVTHNPELARSYSTRIIELKDGNIISDSNKIETIEENETFNLNKTSMSFFTALKLSFNNIMTKKGRTLLTAFASSIGIIGIALILSLSNGFNIQIDEFERDTLSQAPILISEQSINITNPNKNQKELKDYPNKKKVYSLKTVENLVHQNNINKEYVEYIEKMDGSFIGGLGYRYMNQLNILYKNDDKVKVLDTSLSATIMPSSIDRKKIANVLKDNFDVIEGDITTNKEDLFLLVDKKNRVESVVLKALGIEDKDEINFKELMDMEFKVVLNDDYYVKNGPVYTLNTDLDKLYDNENTITLKIKGIIRGKKGNKFADMSGTGLMYNLSLTDYINEKNSESEITKFQEEKDYNVLTMEKFDLTTEEGKKSKDKMLSYLGKDSVPVMIQLYTKNFDSKDDIIKYLDKYNKGKKEKDKILYIDESEMITSLSGGIMDAITIVLIAFSGISLVVSSIMIGIIIYISVLERTKEIGILRAIGARQKDIARVFNAETFIIGLTSGLLGILIARLLDIPINIIIKNLTDLENVARLNIYHAIILVIISVILTTIGGFIPAKIASKKDPVEALRSE